ncbi:GNAT family N-acetyltransferase [Microbacterium marinilacus]|uniref:N-acetyltransferase domain-containing protein n=1 Tax=Microbacterium marinilacus TaxID=415209 RepID=A0ABP7BBJ5_9MICO|nr:GNAT family N-acetyltransferase [Microbacterium marinilacus]MBY0687025.1 GNAT family N-acetyltransferase [Microbacterium marinilacus]
MPPGTTRLAQFPADARAVARLLEDYLRQTEREKAEHGLAPGGAGRLPPRYQAEVDDPATAFADAVVVVAEAAGSVAGVAVLMEPCGDAVAAEIKRLWVDPAFRRAGIGRLLLQECVDRAAGVVRLSVWDWRTPAVRAYEGLGFVQVPSWESRERLICMERTAPPEG